MILAFFYLDSIMGTLGARPTIMHREPIGSGICAVAQSTSGYATEGIHGMQNLRHFCKIIFSENSKIIRDFQECAYAFSDISIR